MAESSTETYHEKQSQMLCGLHALNNLLQRRAFTKHDFDEICYRLSPSTVFNPHRNWLGMGDYDINVLTMAVESTGLSLHWWDKRKKIDELNIDSVTTIGYLLNIPSNVQLGMCKLPMKRPHWIAVRWLSGQEAYFNLDSKLSRPRRIGNSSELRNYLAQQLADSRTQLLIITQPVERIS